MGRGQTLRTALEPLRLAQCLHRSDGAGDPAGEGHVVGVALPSDHGERRNGLTAQDQGAHMGFLACGVDALGTEPHDESLPGHPAAELPPDDEGPTPDHPLLLDVVSLREQLPEALECPLVDRHQPRVDGCSPVVQKDGPLLRGSERRPGEWQDRRRAPTTDDVEVLMTPTPVHPVLVTGATGRVGRVVVDLLVDAGVPVRALTHRSEAAATLPDDVEAVPGDLTVPDSLEAGLRGVDTVFLVWTAPPATAAAVVERLATHVRRVVFLSAPHQTPHPFFQQPNPMAVLYADIERLLAAAGLETTFIRPGMFASNALFWWAPTIRAGHALRWPYGGAETAPVDDRDVAAVAARTLYQDGHAGGDHVLTGPESLSQEEQVGIIGDVLGRPVTFEELSPDEFRRETEGGWPRPAVDMLLAAWGATMGRPAYMTSTVSDILGSPPRSFRQWVTDHAAAFSTGPPSST
jgi:uncharacterized protein YbjT (DUF2867 family)